MQNLNDYGSYKNPAAAASTTSAGVTFGTTPLSTIQEVPGSAEGGVKKSAIKQKVCDALVCVCYFSLVQTSLHTSKSFQERKSIRLNSNLHMSHHYLAKDNIWFPSDTHGVHLSNISNPSGGNSQGSPFLKSSMSSYTKVMPLG